MHVLQLDLKTVAKMKNKNAEFFLVMEEEWMPFYRSQNVVVAAEDGEAMGCLLCKIGGENPKVKPTIRFGNLIMLWQIAVAILLNAVAILLNAVAILLNPVAIWN